MAKDFFHDCVRIALEADGWQITHDPYNLTTTRRDGKKVGIPIDLGAERVFAAEKGEEKIAVEVKSFLRASVVNEFHRAMGQYLMYQIGLNGQEIDRVLYLAIPARIIEEIDDLDLLRDSLAAYSVNILIFDPEKQNIVKWIRH
ncbi:MAG: element excision factor XisH family protein [Saprospiraceae bacterium]|jgi:hypothetical protein